MELPLTSSAILYVRPQIREGRLPGLKQGRQLVILEVI